MNGENFFKKSLIKSYKIVRDRFSKYGFGNFYFVRKINATFLKYVTPNLIIIKGHKMFLDPSDSLRLSIYGNHETNEKEIYKKYIKKGDVVLDVGANIGYDTLILAKLVGKNGRVFAFEPGPINFQLLEKNIKINEYNNVTLVNKAVSKDNKSIKLYLNETNGTGHKIDDISNLGVKLNRKSIDIESIKLDDFLKNKKIKKIDFVKIDVEGSESEVIKGMNNIFKNNKSLKMILEFTPGALKNYGKDPKKYLKEFISKGFKLYEIPDKGSFDKDKIPINNDKDIHDLLKRWGKSGTNLFCIRD